MTDKHFVLLYDFVPDILEKRGPYRVGHLTLLKAAAESGELVLAGAFADGPNGMMILKGEDESVAKKIVDADPYVANGLVTGWRIREWTTVVGEGALTQVKL